MESYLINLERRTDRLATALSEFAQTNLTPTVIKAVDGSTLPTPEGFPNAGAYGCNQSHIQVLERVIAEGQTECLVFEDDVVFINKFNIKFAQFMDILPDNWDACFLGGQAVSPVEPVKEGVVRAGGERGIHRTHAYMIRQPYLSFLLNEWKTKPGHIDWVWGANQKYWHVYAPTYWLCGQGASLSDINGRSLGLRRWDLTPSKFKQPLRRRQR